MQAFARDLRDLVATLDQIDTQLIIATGTGEVSASVAADDTQVGWWVRPKGGGGDVCGLAAQSNDWKQAVACQAGPRPPSHTSCRTGVPGEDTAM